MQQCLKLTKGAFALLAARYRGVLRKCFGAALAAAIFLPSGVVMAALADGLPAPGSSFIFDANMSFSGQTVSYGKIDGEGAHTLTLENSAITAREVNLERARARLFNSSFLSESVMRLGLTYMNDSKISAAENVIFNSALEATSGDNYIVSTGKDIYLGHGIRVGADARLTLEAADEINAVNITATNIHADYVTDYGNLTMNDGQLAAPGLRGNPSMIHGSMNLGRMQATLGHLLVLGHADIAGGSFSAKTAEFYGGAEFSDTAVNIDALAASEFTQHGGSLTIGNDKNNAIAGNFTLEDVNADIGSLKTGGKTEISGGSLNAGEMSLGEILLRNVDAKITDFALSGALSLLDNATLEAGAKNLGANAVRIDASQLKLNGNFTTADLSLRNGSLIATGNVDIKMPDFSLADSTIGGANITLQNISASGKSLLDAGNNITFGDLAIASGRFTAQSGADTGAISGGSVTIANGAAASFQAPSASVASIAGQGSVEGHNLKVAGGMDISGGSLHLSGANSVGGSLRLADMTATVDDFHVRGMANMNRSVVTGKNVTLEQGATLENASSLEAQSVTAGANIVLKNDSELLAGALNMGDSQLLLEGAGGGSAIVASGSFDGGNMTVEANSLLSIGSNDAGWSKLGMDVHKATAALGLWTPLRLDAGARAAIGAGASARSAAANSVFFGANSLMITNAQAAAQSGAGAISAAEPARADIAANARLHILNARADGLYRVLGENISVNYDGNAWEGDNVRTDTLLVKLDRLGGDKLGWFEATKQNASDGMPDLDDSLGGAVDDANKNGQIKPPENVPAPPVTPPAQPDQPIQPDNPVTPPDQPDQPGTPPAQPDNPDQPDQPVNPPDQPSQPDNPDQPDQPAEPDTPATPEGPVTPDRVYTQGQVFLSRATNFWFIGHDARLAARTIESAARIFALGAVPQMTLAANEAASQAMKDRLNDGPAVRAINGDGKAENWHGLSLWIAPLYRSQAAYGLTSGNWNVDVNGGLGGVALGADYTFASNLRLGASFNVGGGYAMGGGDLASTVNNLSFWGLGVYAGWSGGGLDVAADAAFTSTYNKLKQDLPAAMQMDDLKADIAAYAISGGIELGYTWQTAFLDIRPHAGARYAWLYNGSYDVNSGGTVLEGKAQGHSVWSFPLGITFAKQLDFANGWYLRPALDLAVIPTAGDHKTRTEARFTGTNTWADLRDQFRDDITWRGSLALEFGSGDLRLGLNYALDAGQKTCGQTVMGAIAWTF